MYTLGCVVLLFPMFTILSYPFGYSNYYVKSLKLAKGKKSFTVKWKKQSKKNRKKFNGYQIRYSMKSSMENAKYVTASKSSKSKKIKKLKAKKKYYV